MRQTATLELATFQPPPRLPAVERKPKATACHTTATDGESVHRAPAQNNMAMHTQRTFLAAASRRSAARGACRTPHAWGSNPGRTALGHIPWHACLNQTSRKVFPERLGISFRRDSSSMRMSSRGCTTLVNMWPTLPTSLTHATCSSIWCSHFCTPAGLVLCVHQKRCRSARACCSSSGCDGCSSSGRHPHHSARAARVYRPQDSTTSVAPTASFERVWQPRWKLHRLALWSRESYSIY